MSRCECGAEHAQYKTSCYDEFLKEEFNQE